MVVRSLSLCLGLDSFEEVSGLWREGVGVTFKKKVMVRFE